MGEDLNPSTYQSKQHTAKEAVEKPGIAGELPVCREVDCRSQGRAAMHSLKDSAKQGSHK